MLRPQPIGIFPLPAGCLLLLDVAGAKEFCSELLSGKNPTLIPDGLEFYSLAFCGETERAFSKLSDDNSDVARFNRFVLRADENDYKHLRDEISDELKPLLDAVAYTFGFINDVPTGENLDGELRAFILSVRSADAIEKQNYYEAERHLQEAIEITTTVSPVYSAQLRMSLAETQYAANGANASVIQNYKLAADVLSETDLHETHAAVNLNLGICYQETANGERGALLEAVRYYQAALNTFTRKTHAEQFAFAQNNLALCYLMMPLVDSSDQLRMAIAIQALREALKVYRKEMHPELWSGAQLNLANALQYAPTSHAEENLLEAVTIYEELLSLRNEMSDPVGYARILANQGNALAHLGLFSHAEEKLHKAYKLFNMVGDESSALSVRELLNEIDTQKTANAENKNEVIAAAAGVE